MNKQYVALFKELAQSTAASAETVMDYDRAQKDEKGLETATIMRDDYQALVDRIDQAGEDYIITKADAAKLLVGVLIQINQLQDRVTRIRKAVTGYQNNVIPQLQAIAEAPDDDAALAIAKEKFIIDETNT